MFLAEHLKIEVLVVVLVQSRRRKRVANPKIDRFRGGLERETGKGGILRDVCGQEGAESEVRVCAGAGPWKRMR